MSATRTVTSGGSLELIDLAKRYGGTAVVEHVSVSIRPGEFFTLLGPSGSGKTTTLMMVAGFAEPDHGRILLDGQDITSLAAHRRKIGVVFQNYAMFPHMTVAENIGFSLRMRDLPKGIIQERVEAAIALVQLGGFESRYPQQLSGGQQQRVALARALVFEPALLLLDEPLGALDRMLREQMKLELRRVHRDLGTSMMYVTHDQDEALVLSDRIMVMNKGRIEQIGSPDEIYERPANPFVARFVGESNFLPGRLESVSGDRGTVEVAGIKLGGVASKGLTVGAAAELSVRPEKITIRKGAAESSQHLVGVVEDRIYSGDSVRYIVRLADQTAVVVKQIRRSDVPGLVRGEPVSLTWSQDDAVLFAVSA